MKFTREQVEVLKEGLQVLLAKYRGCKEGEAWNVHPIARHKIMNQIETDVVQMLESAEYLMQLYQHMAGAGVK